MHEYYKLIPAEPPAQLPQHVREFAPRPSYYNQVAAVWPVNAKLPYVHKGLINVRKAARLYVEGSDRVGEVTTAAVLSRSPLVHMEVDLCVINKWLTDHHLHQSILV